MNKYESVVLVKETLTEEKRNEILNRIKTLVSENGNLNEVQEIGLRKLAYQIRNNTKAYYYLFNFESKPDFIYELERNYRITDEIIKYINVRQED